MNETLIVGGVAVLGGISIMGCKVFWIWNYVLTRFKRVVIFLNRTMDKGKKQKSLNRSNSKKKNMSAKEGSSHIDNSIFIDVSPEYQNLVKNADRNNEDFFIDNSTVDHAKFLTYTLIKRAKKFIKIFTGNLSEIYYDNGIIVREMQRKMNEGVEIQIITREATKSKEMLELKNRNSTKLSISYLKDKIKLDNHFLLVDSSAFRVEFPHNKKDRETKTFNVYGKANFNNVEIGNHICTIFKNLKKLPSLSV